MAFQSDQLPGYTKMLKTSTNIFDMCELTEKYQSRFANYMVFGSWIYLQTDSKTRFHDIRKLITQKVEHPNKHYQILRNLRHICVKIFGHAHPSIFLLLMLLSAFVKT